MPREASVAIVGGGPAGAAAAITLADFGVQATVFEGARGPQAKIGESLPPSCGPILAKLGLDKWLQDGGHFRSYGNRSIWGQDTPRDQDFITLPHDAGWRLDRYAFEHALARAAVESGAEWHYGSMVRRAERRGGIWHLQVECASVQRQHQARFLIDATGRSAALVRQFGAKRISYGRLIGIGAELEPSRTGVLTDTFTLVEAAACGWWYSSLLPNGRMLAVLMTDHDLPEAAAAKDARQWREMLLATRMLSARIREGGFWPHQPPRVFAAETTRLTAIAGEGWLAAGDAAAAHDPLSSYGIAAALGSGYYAGRAVAHWLDGAAVAHQAYENLMGQAFAAYCFGLADCYRTEQRWRDQPFWRRRHLLSGIHAPGSSDAGTLPTEREAANEHRR